MSLLSLRAECESMKLLPPLFIILLLSYSSYGFAKSPSPLELKTEKSLLINIGDKLSIKYPPFIKTKKLQDGWVRLFHTILYKHEQYQDGKYGVTSHNTYINFDLRVKYYSSLKNALEENHLNGYLEGYLDDQNLHGEALLESISQLDNSSVGPIQKIKNGYSIRTGVEGVGSYYYLIIKHNGVLLFDLPYNINPVKPLQKNKPLNILTDEDRDKLMRFILESATPINKPIEKRKQLQTKKVQELAHSASLIFGADKGIKEEFTPLGFSKNKKFAYTNELFSDGTGCNYFSFNILDLSNDKNIVNMETSPDGCYLDGNKNIEEEFMLEVGSKLEEHNIFSDNFMRLQKFPVSITAGKELNICFSKKAKGLKKGTLTKFSRNLIAYNKSGASKIIGAFEETEFGGSLQIYNPKIEGYFKNPKYDRLAVVVSYSVRGTDGPPNFRRVKIFGSNLAIKKSSMIGVTCSDIKSSTPKEAELAPHTKIKIQAPEEIIKQAPVITPPKNAEPLEQSASGSISLVFLASILGLLGWKLNKVGNG